MLTPQGDQKAVAAEAREFLTTFASLLMATVDKEGLPQASYAPFVSLQDNSFGVFLSALSAHTENLLHAPHASVILIEPEQQAAQIFARRRLTFQCTANCHARDSAASDQLIEAMQQRFGNIVEQLNSLPDFRAFTLTPTRASYVRGFAQAFVFEDGVLKA